MTISRRKREFTREGHRSGFGQETVCEGSALLGRPDNGRVRADSIGRRGHRLCRLPEDGVDDHHDANHRGRQALVARRLLTLPAPASERGAPGGIRTPNPQIRSLMLYPVELRALRTVPTPRLPTWPVLASFDGADDWLTVL